MSGKGHYEHPAWVKMETALDEYQQAREAVLEEEADKMGLPGKRRIQRFTDAADALVKGVQKLAGVDTFECLRVALEKRPDDLLLPEPRALLDEYVCVTFAWEVMKMLGVARHRFWSLLLLVKDRSPSARAKAFLKRVARCHLFGFDAECVVMCRAVLDRECDAEVSGDDVMAWWGTTDKGKKGKPAPLNLWGRIETAAHSGRINEKTRCAAHAVRDAGNEAVHNKPSRSNAVACIQKTVQVLDCLEREKK